MIDPGSKRCPEQESLGGIFKGKNKMAAKYFKVK